MAHVVLGGTTLLSREEEEGKKRTSHTTLHTHLHRHILPSFSRPVLALYVLRPALAGGLINWPFHLVDVHCVTGFVYIWICECMRVCVSV